jgi:hypothetical protein
VGGYKKRMKDAECSGNILCSCVKMEKMRHVETVPGKENDGGGELNFDIL